MGTAHQQGSLWGARARDYADVIEEAERPLFEAVLDAADVGAGTCLLDVGCGPGLALQLAARRGARVAGLDAAEPSLAIARERSPEGDFRAGEMEELPWSDGTFDVVTGINAFQFASHPINALREAGRVANTGGRVVVAKWGDKEACETLTTVAAVTKLLPPPPHGSNGIPPLSPDHVEALLEQAGLAPVASGEVACTFIFPDVETAQRGLMSAGAMVAAANRFGQAVVQRAVIASLVPYQTSTGGYRQHNTFRYVIAMKQRHSGEDGA